MKYETITTEADYDLALAEFGRLLEVPEGSWELERLDALSILIKQYEDIHYPIDPPDPIDAIKFRMEQAGLTEEDLIPCIGSRLMVSEVLEMKRPLTVEMARSLADTFGMAYDVLIPNVEDLEGKASAEKRMYRE